MGRRNRIDDQTLLGGSAHHLWEVIDFREGNASAAIIA